MASRGAVKTVIRKEGKVYYDITFTDEDTAPIEGNEDVCLLTSTSYETPKIIGMNANRYIFKTSRGTKTNEEWISKPRWSFKGLFK
jgi:hypothetical protein